MNKRILSPYGIEPKKLKQHLIDIGFTKKTLMVENDELDFSFINYKIEEEFIMTQQNIEDSVNYNEEQFDITQWNKDGLQIQIDYPYKMCLIEPFDDGLINYDDIFEDIDEKQQDSDENDEDCNDYYNDYSCGKNYYY
jgi:hypothetical protein